MSQQIAVDVRTLFALADQPVPETLLPSATLEAMVREQFAFLPKPIEVALDGWTALVTYPDGPPTAEAEYEGQVQIDEQLLGDLLTATTLVRDAVLKLGPV